MEIKCILGTLKADCKWKLISMLLLKLLIFKDFFYLVILFETEIVTGRKPEGPIHWSLPNVHDNGGLS